MNRGVAVAAVTLLIAAACGLDRGDVSAPDLITTTLPDDPSGAGVAPPSGTAAPATVEQVDCPAPVAGDTVACGVATVPIDRTDPDGGTTRITIATMQGYDPGFRTPLAVLQGGPGGASTELAGWFPQQPFTQVFVDQRGTGFVGPDFDCHELPAVFPRMLAGGSAEGGILYQEAVDDCARRLDQDPVLTHTTSDAHAADVADVMAALGYDRWVVYGVSYGSTIALELMRDQPAGLVGAVLDGVYPPQLDVDAGLAASADAAAEEVGLACAADAICRGYLDGVSFVATLEAVMADLDADPMVVTVDREDLGLTRDLDVVLDGQRLAEFTFLMLYSESRLRYLPAVIGALAERDESAARWMAATGAALQFATSSANDEGTFFAVQCHDRLPFTDGPGDDLSPFADAIAGAPLAPLCAGWERPPAAPMVGEPVGSDIPTLLLSGRFDPITPPAFASDVAERLTRATEVTQGGRGHGIWFGNDCIAQIVQLFVADPARVLDVGCADEGVPVEWARP